MTIPPPKKPRCVFCRGPGLLVVNGIGARGNRVCAPCFAQCIAGVVKR